MPAKALSGWGVTAAASLSIFSAVIAKSVELIAMNNSSYVKMMQSGFLVSDSLTGMSKAAIAANMGLADFTELASKNASVLAQWEPDSAKQLGDFSRNVRLNSDLMGRFGFNTSEVNEYLTDYLGVQQKMGFLNKINNTNMNAGFQQFIADAGEFSTIVGNSRRDVIERTTKLLESPKMNYLLSPQAIEPYTHASEVINSMFKGDMGTQVSKLLMDLTSNYAHSTKRTTRIFRSITKYKSSISSATISNAANMRSGKEALSNNKELAIALLKSKDRFKETSAAQYTANGLYTEQITDMRDSNMAFVNVADAAAKVMNQLNNG